MAKKWTRRIQQGEGAIRREDNFTQPSTTRLDRLTGGTPSLPGAHLRRDLIFAGLLLLLLLVIYNSNFRTIGTDDSIPARLLPFNLVLNHNLYLDQWVQPQLSGPVGPHGAYFVVKSRGHWMSRYPLITPFVVAPLYVVPALWLSRHSPPLSPDSPDFTLIVNTMEKFSASLIAALSAAVLFLALRKVATRNVSLAVALIYGLASNTWTISSQSLWRHGLTELSFAILLWGLFRLPDSPSAPFWAGLGLAGAAANKPLEVILVVAFVIYFVGRKERQKGLLFLTPLVVLGLLVLGYNLYFFAKPLGAYRTPEFVTEVNVRLPFLARIAGDLHKSLVSSSRGLLLLVPGAFLALLGAVRLWKEKRLAWGRPLVLASGSLGLASAVYFFTKFLRGLPPQAFAAASGDHLPLLARHRIGLLGSLIAPSHGLLVYSPWVVFALWGAARLWKEKSPAWSRPLLIALAAIWVIQMVEGSWWGGWCFGPRYLTDLLPFLAWFLVPVWAGMRARPVLRAVFACTVACAIWVQVVGAFYYPAGNWDGSPIDIDKKPQRCWNLSDNQLRRSWKAGPEPPYLLIDWEKALRLRK